MKIVLAALALTLLSGCKMYKGDDPLGWHFEELRAEFAKECNGLVTDNSQVNKSSITLDLSCTQS